MCEYQLKRDPLTGIYSQVPIEDEPVVEEQPKEQRQEVDVIDRPIPTRGRPKSRRS